jgi:ligand-binding SRPBCC domain-containing protein
VKTYVLERTQWLPRPLNEVFAFFADPANLNTLTPRKLNFRILTPSPISMRPGTLIDYSIRLRGFPMQWRTRITAFDPPNRFIDEQAKGPYALWVHTHTFTSDSRHGVEGTAVTDHVEYALPGWLPGPVSVLIHRTLVARDLAAIFDFRAKTLNSLFPSTAK